jgi:hypothetical protein
MRPPCGGTRWRGKVPSMSTAPDPILEYAPITNQPTRYGQALGFHYLGFGLAGICMTSISVFWLHQFNRYLGTNLSFAVDLVVITVVGAISVTEFFIVGGAFVHIGRRRLRVLKGPTCVLSGIGCACMLFAPMIIDQSLTDQTAITDGGDPASSGWGSALGWTLAFVVYPLVTIWIMLRRSASDRTAT